MPRLENLERPKVVLDLNRATALLHFILFHAIPVSVAIALIVLNMKTRLYGTDATWIPALQFIAKVHEILMRTSIITIVVAYLQYLLTGRRAVPFGAIFSTYRVKDMSYLWSCEFYATLTASGFSGLMRIGFLVFVPFSVLLTAAVGPSSVIAMQPRLTNSTVADWRVALNVTRDALYPVSFSG